MFFFEFRQAGFLGCCIRDILRVNTGQGRSFELVVNFGLVTMASRPSLSCPNVFWQCLEKMDALSCWLLNGVCWGFPWTVVSCHISGCDHQWDKGRMWTSSGWLPKLSSRGEGAFYYTWLLLFSVDLIFHRYEWLFLFRTLAQMS